MASFVPNVPKEMWMDPFVPGRCRALFTEIRRAGSALASGTVNGEVSYPYPHG